ncbi:hypothetical protein ACJMK2_011465 [Sinanodonta woodiana]|uniref:C2H2-type domain-containing protein n=1 Tax=Sinanodonta woodiana TaxID=1069815 RepID=A0ABD3V538_SINWO
MTTWLITVKSLTNTRGRAYKCRKCPVEVAIVGEKIKVPPFYCRLCTFRCQYQRGLKRHVWYYSAHREKASQLREMGCPVNEEASLFQNLHPYLPGDSDMEMLGREDSKKIWRERSRQGEMCSQLPTMMENVQDYHEIGAIITLAHPAAPMMLAEAERSISRNDNSSAQSEVNFLDELLDCGSPIHFFLSPPEIRQHTPVSHNAMACNSTSVQQREAHNYVFNLAEQPKVTAVEGHQQKFTSKTSFSCSSCSYETKEELSKLVAGINTLRDIMENQTYRTLNSNITTMIEHLNDKKKQHPREDGCKNQNEEERDKYSGGHQDRRKREEDKTETVRVNQSENRRELSPMRCKHRHSPYLEGRFLNNQNDSVNSGGCEL